MNFGTASALAHSALLTELLRFLRDRGVLSSEEIGILVADAIQSIAQPQATDDQRGAVGLLEALQRKV